MGSALGTIELAAVVAVAAAAWWSEGRRALVAAIVERRIARRSRRALAAAREAAEDEERFAPERLDAAIRRIAGGLLGDHYAAQLRWELLRVINRAGIEEDRVLARVRARAPNRSRGLRSRLAALTEPGMDERWTLAAQGEDWILIARSADARATLPLAAPLIPTPAADDERLSAASLQELARRDEAVRDWAGSGHDPAFELLDRSLLDGRYTPALMEAAIRRIVDAWEVAAAGNEAPLRLVATAPAVDALLHPRQDPHVARLVVRDLRVTRTQLRALDGTRAQVDVVVRGARWLVSARSGAHVAGAPHAERDMPLAWTLEIGDGGPSQWALVATSDPFTAAEPPAPAVRLLRRLSRRTDRDDRGPHHQ